jgi:hypothetical protein
MMADAFDDFKQGLKHKPNAKNITTTAVEKMRTSAFEDTTPAAVAGKEFKRVLEGERNEKTTRAAVAEKDFKPGPEGEPNEKTTPATVAEKDFKPGPEGEPNEKTIRAAATAEKEFKSGPEVEPNEKITPAVAEKDCKQGPEGEPNEKIIRAAAVAAKDFKPGPYKNNGRTSKQQQRESWRRSFVGRVQFRDALDSIVRMGQLEHPQILTEEFN